MIPAGELDASVEAEPPLTDSTRPTVASARTNWSCVPKAMSPNWSTGRPSSWISKYLEPPVASGTPRTDKLVLPSPADDSVRIPGIWRKISAVVRGAARSIWSGRNVEIEIEELSAAFGLVTPVTTTSFTLLTVSFSTPTWACAVCATPSWSINRPARVLTLK